MVSEAEYKDRVGKFLKTYDRLSDLQTNGKITQERYEAARRTIEDHAGRLKRMTIEAIDTRLDAIDTKANGMKSLLESKHVSIESYSRESKSMLDGRAELESERDMIELFATDEFVAYLRKAQDDEKLTKRLGPLYRTGDGALFGQARDGSNLTGLNAIMDDMTGWMWAYVALVACVGLLAGFFSGSPFMLLFFPLIVVFLLGLSAAFLHFSTKVAGLEGPSYVRALRCTMVASISELAASLLVVTPLSQVTQTLPIAGTLTLAMKLLLPFVILIYCLNRVYETSLAKAAIASALYWMLIVVLLGILFAILMGAFQDF